MEEIQTPLLKSRIKELQSQVNSYNGNTLSTFSIQDITKSKKLYIIIPIVILFLLLIFQPNFIKNEVKNDKGEVVNKLSFQKIFISWIIISGLLNIGLFASNYEFKK